MVKLIIINKEGTVKEQKVNSFSKDELYKKAGLKKPDDFQLRAKWNVKKRSVELWAKDSGRANTENKYDFPPPVDSKLYFGNCILIDSHDKDLTENDWLEMYETLFGGFEDLSATAKEDEEESDELEHISPSKKTKQGYLKDGFVVDTNSEDEPMSGNLNSEMEDNSSDETDEDDINVILENDDTDTEFIDDFDSDDPYKLEKSDHLEKEPYIYSSEDD